jgi:hypothetical protein
MKYLIVFLMLFFFYRSNGQAVVEDPVLAELMTQLNVMVTTNQVENSTEFVQQTTTLKNTLDFMKNVDEKLKKINKKINDVIYYKNLIETQLKIIRNQIEYIAHLKEDDKITVEEIEAVNRIFGQLLTKSEKLLELASNTLKEDHFEMDDWQRLDILKDINEEMTDILCQVDVTQRNFYYLSRDRELQDAFKNW